MPHDLPKAYEPGAIEPRWAEYWVNEKLFHVETPRARLSASQTFTLTLPPPNVTGHLHMGHMLEHTEIDIIVRWKRMSGIADAVAARHRPRRHRHAADGGAPARRRGQEPPRHGPRSFRRARVGLEEALRRRDPASR